jgi:hypothetical protein
MGNVQNFGEFLLCERASFSVANAIIGASCSFSNDALILSIAVGTIP